MEERVDKSKIIICRCEDVSLEDVEKLIEKGVTDLETIKRLLRIGMGPCQGRTCIPLLIRILSRKLRKRPEELLIPQVRPPIVPLPLGLFLTKEEEDGKSEG